MPTITIGSMLAAVVQFLVFMLLLQPAIVAVTPSNFTASYYGNVVNGTNYNYTHVLYSPLVSNANSSSVGFRAITPTSLSSFGGLAFIVGFMGQLWGILSNFPNMLWIVFAGSFSYIPFIPIAITGLLSIGILSYVGILVVMKLGTIVSKVVWEET